MKDRERRDALVSAQHAAAASTTITNASGTAMKEKQGKAPAAKVQSKGDVPAEQKELGRQESMDSHGNRSHNLTTNAPQGLWRAIIAPPPRRSS
ncbi:hypothetical protein W97_01537 [Coniosporium apollinis CBS 100218]|uniref:Uncharacterized protein n=1 Tax=Coniosporium apollinis (strain CBS 100218) TaxID=1168221 RepID=R7YKZ8_CONA1|nr:uncharacterized protein W97_01537 [Coniosporium apollinis CBS 100218]EON62316.1 hypothetical protein W97_01537 [Coniosporium apollinis CBS 100218]